MANYEKIIDQAVKKGLEAGYRAAKEEQLDTYKATERRLYALPDLRLKIEKDKQYLQDLQNQGPGRRSLDIVRLKRSGTRLSDSDLLSALVQDTEARIAADEHEIKTIEEALGMIAEDEYYLAVSGRYLNSLSDEQIGVKIHCDPRTVRRNRGRLVRRLAVLLYGASAV